MAILSFLLTVQQLRKDTDRTFSYLRFILSLSLFFRNTSSVRYLLSQHRRFRSVRVCRDRFPRRLKCTRRTLSNKLRSTRRRGKGRRRGRPDRCSGHASAPSVRVLGLAVDRSISAIGRITTLRFPAWQRSQLEPPLCRQPLCASERWTRGRWRDASRYGRDYLSFLCFSFFFSINERNNYSRAMQCSKKNKNLSPKFNNFIRSEYLTFWNSFFFFFAHLFWFSFPFPEAQKLSEPFGCSSRRYLSGDVENFIELGGIGAAGGRRGRWWRRFRGRVRVAEDDVHQAILHQRHEHEHRANRHESVHSL